VYYTKQLRGNAAVFRQQRISIHASDEDLARLEVEDALAATPAERMAAAIELLEGVLVLDQAGVER